MIAVSPATAVAAYFFSVAALFALGIVALVKSK